MDVPNWEHLLSEQVRQNSRLFYQLAYRILRDDAAAQDACQQAFKQAWEHRSKIDPGGGRLTRWIAQTVKMECLQKVRRVGIERRVLANHASIQPDSTDLRTDQDLSEAIRAAVDGLPEPWRSMITMKYFDGMSSSEIGIALECNDSELWRQMHRALERLRPSLSKWHQA